MIELAPRIYQATVPVDIGAACWRSFTCRAPRQMNSTEVLRDLFAQLPMQREGWDSDLTRIELIEVTGEDKLWKVSRDV